MLHKILETNFSANSSLVNISPLIATVFLLLMLFLTIDGKHLKKCTSCNDNSVMSSILISLYKFSLSYCNTLYFISLYPKNQLLSALEKQALHA